MGTDRAVRPSAQRLLFAAVVLVALAACSSEVAVDVPSPPQDVRAACLRLTPILPDFLAGQARRAASPASELTAAWGDPPLALRCGVPRPASYTPTVEVISVNGLDWFPEKQPNGYVFTTVSRVADVQITVPGAYAPEVNPLAELSGPIAEAIAAVRR